MFFMFLIFFPQAILKRKCWYCAPGDDSKRVRKCSVEHQNAQKLEFLHRAPCRIDFQNMRIWSLNENVDIVHLEKIPKIFRKCVSWTPKWSKKSGLDGILVQMGSKILKNELSKRHTSLLNKSFHHTITMFSSSVFALRDFLYFEKMQVISCDL